METEMARFLGSPLLAAFLLFASGCGDGGPRTYPIPGKAAFEDGTPVESGSIVFQIELDGKPVPARGMVKDGAFTLTTFKPNDGIVAGEHAVSLRGLPPAEGAKPPANPIPAKYGDFGTSGLKATVAPDTKEIVIKIAKGAK